MPIGTGTRIAKNRRALPPPRQESGPRQLTYLYFRFDRNV